LIDPAVAHLQAAGATVRISARITALPRDAGRLTALTGPDGPIPLGPTDAVVLAVPPWIAAALLPELTVPTEFQSIVNLHFRLDADPGPPASSAWSTRHRRMGFRQARHRLGHHQRRQPPGRPHAEDQIANTVWPEVRTALSEPSPTPIPPYRVVKESAPPSPPPQRKTPCAPPHATSWHNLALAGDWTATGLPGHHRRCHQVRPDRRLAGGSRGLVPAFTSNRETA
jgi:hydroxysqualene dehydroxylase